MNINKGFFINKIILHNFRIHVRLLELKIEMKNETINEIIIHSKTLNNNPLITFRWRSGFALIKSQVKVLSLGRCLEHLFLQIFPRESWAIVGCSALWLS